MGLYERYVLPHVINMSCSAPPILKQREKVVPLATGRVLEVGMGSGINLSFYNPDKVETMYLPGAPKIFAFNYWGQASVA